MAIGVQESKQEDTKVVSLVKSGVKSAGVSIHLKGNLYSLGRLSPFYKGDKFFYFVVLYTSPLLKWALL